MRTSFTVVLAAALVAGGCTCGGADRSEPAPALDRTPAPIPEGWHFELHVGGDVALAALRERLPDTAARAALPLRVADVLDATIPVPTSVLDAIESGSPLRCITMARPGAPEERDTACAVRLERTPPDLAIEPGGPRGSGWIAGAPSAIAIADRVVVAASDRAIVERAMPWLAFTAMDEEIGSPVRVRIAAGMGGQVRPLADAMISSGTRGARARIAEERAEHEGPPDLGEPEAVVELVADVASGLAAYLPDLGAIEATLEPLPDGLAVRARAEVREGSALARALASVPDAGPIGIEAVPASAAIGWTIRASEPTPAGELTERIASLAGHRLDAPSRAALGAAITEWSSSRGPSSTVALALEEGALALVVATDGAEGCDPAPFAGAIGSAWAQGLLAPVVGCEPPCVEAFVSERGGACAIAIGDRRADALRVAALAGDRSLARSPRVADLLAGGPADAIARAIVVPERLAALVARVAGRDAPAPELGDPHAVVLTIGRDAGALVVDVRATSGALEALARVIGPS